MAHPIEKEMRSMMRKTCMALGIFMLVNAASIHIPTILHAQQVQPAYAKWGKLAIKETQSKYPNAKVIDYLHEGSESQKDVTIEKFKLWLKEGDNEFGVFVRIKYRTETEQVITIELQETPR
jgi:hypothetical protein